MRDLADRAPRTTLEQALRAVISRAELLGESPRWELRVDGTPRELAPAQVETLHRAAQSLVANVQRHAEAERCVLTLAWWPGRVSLDVVDDGRGFDPLPRPAATRAATDCACCAPASPAPAAPWRSIRPLGEGTTVGLTLPTHTQESDA